MALLDPLLLSGSVTTNSKNSYYALLLTDIITTCGTIKLHRYQIMLLGVWAAVCRWSNSIIHLDLCLTR